MAISTANVTEPGSFGTSKPAFLEASIVRVLKLFILMLLQPWRTKDFSHPERSISFRQVRNLEICWKCGFHYILVSDSKIQSFLFFLLNGSYEGEGAPVLQRRVLLYSHGMGDSSLIPLVFPILGQFWRDKFHLLFHSWESGSASLIIQTTFWNGVDYHLAPACRVSFEFRGFEYSLPSIFDV